MTEFIVLNQDDVATLFIDKPVTVDIDKKPYVLCTDKYFEKQRTEMTELKPCPFCGSNKVRMYSERDNSVHGFMHICEGFAESMVKVESRLFSTEEEAIEAWNRRVTDDKQTHISS